MSRRGLILFLLAVTATGCGSGARPNVLVVVMDTARGDRFSFSGYERPTSPSLKALARESVVFRDAWSASPWTGPSHATIFTGLRPENHGYTHGNRPFLLDEAVTLAETLGDAGYRTACLTNNVTLTAEFGLIQGFATYESILDRGEDAPPNAGWSNQRALELAREARVAGAPFFLFLNQMEPHLPYDPPEELASRFLAPDADPGHVGRMRELEGRDAMMHNLGAKRIEPADWAVLSDLYDAEIASIDAAVGELVESLRGEGLLDDTVVVITSDHGENLGEHGFGSHQFSLHRTTLNVPLLIRFPGSFDGGREVGEVVRLEDLFPTILELCDIPVPEGLDGLSLLDAPAGRIALGYWGPAPIERIGSDFPGQMAPPMLGASIRSIYDGRHHYLEYSDSRIALYDIPADPGEERNLALEDTKTADRMGRLLRRND